MGGVGTKPGVGKKPKVITKSEKYLKFKKKPIYKIIRKDILDQLERNGTIGKYYEDLIEDYMDMWIIKTLLVEDIQNRGVSVKYDNGGGQTGFKKNDSVDQKLKTNAQMVNLLEKLGIKPSTSSDGDGDEL